ncbi:MAG: methyltransferase domain-containing protein [Oscillospiraceae bacterium]|nr:methyltransferase domain-containing protein [Oscillospiraceae bacterium]
MENIVQTQYSTADKLNTRISLHAKYSVNKQGFGDWIASHYAFRPGMSVLELGGGTGDMWRGNEDLIRRCGRFVLSDCSAGMLESARKTLSACPEIEFRLIDIRQIPFPDGSFDAVIANMMLYHVPELTRGLREVRRVLKDGGRFYCATYGENGMMAWIGRLFAEQRVEARMNTVFTLQNGEAQLTPFFSSVERLLYKDALAVTDLDDLIDYILSLSSLSELQKLPRETLRSVLEAHMRDGVLTIPKEYGLFVATK